MKLKALHIRNAPPVERFEIDDLSDVVVIAGPNGVGKTRLIQRIITRLRSGGVDASAYAHVEATCPAEQEAWGKRYLDLSLASDAALFTQTLQVNRFRRNLTSSLVNFESDRTVQALKPMAFSFDFADPDKEEVGWDATFGYMRDRFQDTVHSMYRIIEAQKQSYRKSRSATAEGRPDVNDPSLLRSDGAFQRSILIVAWSEGTG